MAAAARSLHAAQSLRLTSSRCQYSMRSFSTTATESSERASHLPRVAKPSFWSSMIPRASRRPTDSEEAAKRAAKRSEGAEERRVGITFLILGIVVGSNAIHLMNIKREMLNFTRHTDAKISTLREVIERVKNGEDVDVEKLLGTGDPQHEKEWDQVIKELEKSDMLWEGRKKREAEREAKAEKRRLAEQERSQAKSTAPSKSSEEPTDSKPSGPNFYM